MVDTYLKFENNKFLDKAGNDIYKKYDFKEAFYEDGAIVGDTIEEGKFTVLKEYKRSSHKYIVVKDDEDVIFPLHLKNVEGRIALSPVTTKTRGKLFEEMENDEEIKKAPETHHMRASAYPPKVDDSEYQIENDGDILNIKSVHKRQQTFASLPFDKQISILNNLFSQDKVYDASVLINNKYLEDFYNQLSPEDMKRYYTTISDSANNYSGKEKNHILDDLSSILDSYPKTNELYNLFEGSNKQQEKFFDTLSPKKLKEIYKTGGEEVKQHIDNYLAFNIICYGMLRDAAKQNKNTFKQGKEYYKDRDKRVPYSKEEHDLYGLNDPSTKEIDHYNKVQAYVKKYNMIPTNAGSQDHIKVYDISKITAVPFLDKTKFRFHQHAYLNKFDSRQSKNLKIIKKKLDTSISVATDKYNEYNYMFEHAQAQHKAVHSIFKRKQFNEFLKQKQAEMNSESVSNMYKIDKVDVDMLKSIKALLAEVERQNAEHRVEIVETPPVERTEVSEDTPIRTEDREKVGMFRRVFGSIGKRRERTETAEETVSEGEAVRRAA